MINSQTEVKFISIYVEENQGWFSAVWFNALFHIDFLTRKTEYIGYFPKEEAVSAYRNILSYKQYLFFIPYCGSTIGIYDRNTEMIVTKSFPLAILNKLCEIKFAFAYVYNDCIYMYGQDNAIIVEYNIASQSFLLIDVLTDGEEIKGFGSAMYELADGKIYTLVNHNSAVIELSLENFGFKILKINNKKSFCSFIKREDKLWIMDIAGKLYEYDLAEERCQSYDLIDIDERETNNSEFFWFMYEYNNKLYMLAMLNHASYIFDMVSKTFQKNKKLQIESHRKFPFWTNDIMPIWCVPMQYNDQLYFQWEADLTLRILDLKSNQLEILPVMVDKKHYAKALIKQKMERGDLLFETEDEFSLDLFLDTL